MDSYLSARKDPNPVKRATLPAEYKWLVIVDPSGFYRSRYFRPIDIEINNRTRIAHECWPEGIAFQNIKTLEVRAVQGGFMNRYCPTGWRLYLQWSNLSEEIRKAGGNPNHSRSMQDAENPFKSHINGCKTCKALISRFFAHAEKQEVKQHMRAGND